jgi:hypothetical protein
MQKRKLLVTLQSLCEHNIQFVIVGGIAAALHGAPGQTYEVGFVYSREPANIERSLTFLKGACDPQLATWPPVVISIC